MRSRPDHIPEAQADYDPAAHRWQLQLGGHSLALREWTWGERKRLLNAAIAGGQLDGDCLASAFCELLYTPPPPPQFATLFASAGLALLAADRPKVSGTLVAAERDLLAGLGLAPSAIDAELVSDIEALHDSLAGSAGSAEPGWNRLDFAVLPEEPA